METHPWPPYIPEGARIIIMGTFPPQQKRWSMDFYYPNLTNDFWPMMGLIFYGDRDALRLPGKRQFNLDAIKRLLDERHIAMSDTGYKVRRLRDNASDKYLEIVEPVHLDALLARIPHCLTIATTGEKAAQVIATLTGTEPPAKGSCVTAGPLTIWRMPSTSRAYPLPLEQKADYYRTMFRAAGII